MASFDIVSKVDLQTLDNAVNTAKREVDTRYDLRGSNSTIELDKKALSIRISTEDNMKLEAIEKILLERSSKQQIDVKSYDLSQEPQPSGKLVIKTIRVQQGIDREKAKRIVKAIKDSKLKVQPQIMDDMVRVTGKKIDDLQAAIALCKGEDFDVPLQYENMKS